MSQEAKLLYTERATRGHRFVEFRQLQEVGVFSYLVYFRFKSLVNDLDVVRPEMAMDLGSKEVEPRLMRGLSTDSPHTIFGDC